VSPALALMLRALLRACNEHVLCVSWHVSGQVEFGLTLTSVQRCFVFILVLVLVLVI